MRGVLGGREHIYVFSRLPAAVRHAIDAAELTRLKATFAQATAAPAPLPAPDERPLATGPNASRRRDARLAIYAALQELKTASGYSEARAMSAFSALYAHAALEVKAGRPAPGPHAIASLPPYAFEVQPKMSSRTLMRIASTVQQGDLQKLKGHFHSRKGTGALDIAVDPRGAIKGPGAVKKALLALIADHPHLSARALRDQIIGNFGAELILPSGQVVPMPPPRTFQWHIAKMKAENESLIMAVASPDDWRSKYEYAFGEQHCGDGLNDIWQIDASPADVLTLDGRYSVYVLIDLWSRRIMILVTKTPRAAAVVALLRRAILAWGVPNTVKTDNGSDFKAKAVKAVLEALKIDHPLSPAFTPTDKGHVERAIGTLQHDFGPLQPGFIGHNVADRAAIEARRSFAQRLGDSDPREAFCVQLQPAELQRRVDAWAEVQYPHRAHEGLGMTPAEREASWSGAVRRVKDERALDLLLWDLADNDGYRTVGKKGLRNENATFWGPGLEPGMRVRVRLDPTDMGRVYVYTAEDDAFICVAEAPERVGIDRAEVAARAKAEQRAAVKDRKSALRSAKRSLRPLHEVAEEVARSRLPRNVTSFPRPVISHETPALAAAADAAGSERPPVPETARPVVTPAKVLMMTPTVRPESQAERDRRVRQEAYARWKRIDAQAAIGAALTDVERRFHRDYPTLPEFSAMRRAEQLMASGAYGGGAA
ncbi:MAG TPA: DDE-type integrase/transposase/recombinase [Xanthobacteraceae bacterium]|nr:DDE-type integrase/transposase/recombinase [Xanthobacteraceae bacterium]